MFEGCHVKMKTSSLIIRLLIQSGFDYCVLIYCNLTEYKSPYPQNNQSLLYFSNVKLNCFATRDMSSNPRLENEKIPKNTYFTVV